MSVQETTRHLIWVVRKLLLRLSSHWDWWLVSIEDIRLFVIWCRMRLSFFNDTQFHIKIILGRIKPPPLTEDAVYWQPKGFCRLWRQHMFGVTMFSTNRFSAIQISYSFDEYVFNQNQVWLHSRLIWSLIPCAFGISWIAGIIIRISCQ